MLYHQPIDKRRTDAQTMHSAHTRRPAMEQTPGSRGAYAGEGVIQAQTRIRYSPGRYDYDFNPEEGRFRKSVTVGREMEAELDPDDPKKGSSTGSGGSVHKDLMRYLGRKWSTPMVRGHLLNDHLGGLSVEENLFPISKAANSAHLNAVERYVKYFTYNRNIFGFPSIVCYRISVRNDGDYSQKFDEFHPQTAFDCMVEVRPKGEAGCAAGNTGSLLKAEYCIMSDISNGASAWGGNGFGEKTPYSANTSGEWKPGNTKLENRQDRVIHGENGYELRRKEGDTSLGNVNYEDGGFIVSEDWHVNAYLDREKRWGHMALEMYESLQDRLMARADEILSDGNIVPGAIYQRAAEAAAQEARKVQPDIPQAVVEGVGSLYTRRLQEMQSGAVEMEAETLFQQNKEQVINIIFQCDGMETASKERLLQAYTDIVQAVSDRHLQICYSNGYQMIADTVRNELRTIIMPMMWENKSDIWFRQMEQTTIEGGESAAQKNLTGLMQASIMTLYSNGGLVDHNATFIHRIIEAGAQGNLCENILCPAIEGILDIVIAKMRRMILANLETNKELVETCEQVLLSAVGQGVDSSARAAALRQEDPISSEMWDTAFREAYKGLGGKMGREVVEQEDDDISGDIVEKLSEDMVRKKTEAIQDVLFRMFNDALTLQLQWKEKAMELFAMHQWNTAKIAEDIMKAMNVGQDGNKICSLLNYNKEQVKKYIDTTSLDYDWLDISQKTEESAGRTDWDKNYLAAVICSGTFSYQYIKPIINRVVYRWVFEAGLEEKDDDDDSDYEE